MDNYFLNPSFPVLQVTKVDYGKDKCDGQIQGFIPTPPHDGKTSCNYNNLICVSLPKYICSHLSIYLSNYQSIYLTIYICTYT